MEILSPVTLVRRLPQSSRENGGRHFAPVYGVRAGQKRKRQEICIATDGDSLTIYKAQNGQSVASYVVPPTSSFCCKPCTMRTTQGHGSAPTRRTYCAVKDDETRIQCFTDNSQPGQLKDPLVASTSLRHADSSITYLDIMPNTGEVTNKSSDLVVLQEDGSLSVLSGDLHKRIWETRLALGTENRPVRVLCAQVVSSEDASKSALKQRRDISGTIHDNSSLLVVVLVEEDQSSQPEKLAQYGLWQIDPKQKSAPQNHTFIKPLLVHSLPRSERWLRDSKAKLEFALKASSLSIGFSRGMVTYDLTSLTPRTSSELVLDAPELLTTIPLSSSLLACATANHLKIYDSKYQSIQSSLDLAKKRKRSNGAPGASVRFVEYFAQLGRIIAMRRNELLAFDVKTSSRVGSKERPPRLADCLGLGAPLSSLVSKGKGNNLELSFGTVEWDVVNGKTFTADIRNQLDQLSQDGDAVEFDKLVMSELRDYSIITRVDLNDEQASLLESTNSISQVEVGYLISKIFRYTPSSEAQVDGRLTIVLPATRVISWLSHRGFLHGHELAKHLVSNSNVSRAPVIQPGLIAQTLLSCFEPGLLNGFIEGASSDIQELVETIKILLMRVIQQAQDSPRNVLLAADNDDPMNEGQPGRFAKPTTLMNICNEHEVQQNEVVAETGAGDASVRWTLSLAASRLGGYGMSMISAKLRSSFSASEILSLIQFLRQELFYGGHTFSSHQRPYSVPAPSDIHDQAKIGSASQEGRLSLNVIVKLLSGCIDAVGPVGFFNQGDHDGFVENMIPDLRSEIARATEAIEEASYLQGILRETIRYADSVDERRVGGDKSQVTGGDPDAPQKLGTILTLYSEPNLEQGDIEATGGVLPLSLRPDNVVSKTKVRKGGGQVSERSVREMHMLRARQKGRYALERVVL